MHAGPHCCEQSLLPSTRAAASAVSSRDQAAQTSDSFSYPEHQSFNHLHRLTSPASRDQAAQTSGSFSTSFQKAIEGLTGHTTDPQQLGKTAHLPSARLAQHRPFCLQKGHFISGQQGTEDNTQPGGLDLAELSVKPETSFESDSSCQGQQAADSAIAQIVRSSQAPAEGHSCGNPLQGIVARREAAGHSCGKLLSETTAGQSRADSVLRDWHLPKPLRAAQSSTNPDSSSSSASINGTDIAAEANWQVQQEMAEQAMPAVNVSLQDWNLRGLQPERLTTASQQEQVHR